MLGNKWATPTIATIVWILCAAGMLTISEYKKFVIVADDFVKKNYPIFNLNKFSRNVSEDESRVMISYLCKNDDPSMICVGGGPIVFIDKASGVVVGSALSQ